MHLEDEKFTVLKLRVLEPVLVRGQDAKEVNEELETALVHAADLENRVHHTVAHRVGSRYHFLLVVLVDFAQHALGVAEYLQLLDLVLLFEKLRWRALVDLSHDYDDRDLEVFGDV